MNGKGRKGEGDQTSTAGLYLRQRQYACQCKGISLPGQQVVAGITNVRQWKRISLSDLM